METKLWRATAGWRSALFPASKISSPTVRARWTTRAMARTLLVHHRVLEKDFGNDKRRSDQAISKRVRCRAQPRKQGWIRKRSMESRCCRRCRQSTLVKRNRWPVCVHRGRIEEPLESRIGSVDRARPLASAWTRSGIDCHGCAGKRWPRSGQVEEGYGSGGIEGSQPRRSRGAIDDSSHLKKLRQAGRGIQGGVKDTFRLVLGRRILVVEPGICRTKKAEMIPGD
jgi:hypothetical protein